MAVWGKMSSVLKNKHTSCFGVCSYVTVTWPALKKTYTYQITKINCPYFQIVPIENHAPIIWDFTLLSRWTLDASVAITCTPRALGTLQKGQVRVLNTQPSSSDQTSCCGAPTLVPLSKIRPSTEEILEIRTGKCRCGLWRRLSVKQVLGSLGCRTFAK